MSEEEEIRSPDWGAQRYELLREYTRPKLLHEELAMGGKLPASYKWRPIHVDDDNDVGELLAERVDEILDQAIEYQWELHDADELTED